MSMTTKRTRGDNRRPGSGPGNDKHLPSSTDPARRRDRRHRVRRRR